MPSRVCRDGIQNQVHIFIDLICQREIALSIMEIIRKKPKSLIRSFDKTLIPNSCTQLTSCELNLAAKRCNLDRLVSSTLQFSSYAFRTTYCPDVDSI